VVSNRGVMHAEYRPGAVSSGIGPASVAGPSAHTAAAEMQ
jgi:hypothetical protein